MGAESVSGTSYAGSTVSSSRSSGVKKTRADIDRPDENGDDIWDRRSTLEHGVFGVLFTLSKEKSETRIRIRWVLLKILLDGWQLFTTVINPEKQGWSINAESPAWTVINVLNFTWLGKLGYDAYVAVLYSMLGLLAINVVLCVWVAWCFKEHKFPVVWPIKVLRVFSSVFFQAFDVASLNLLQLGISCRYTGPPPHLRFDLFPEYKCTAQPQLEHAIVSACCLVLFVVIALLLNMAEVEVNPLSRRPLALGHSGAEVMAFAIKVLLTLVDVFLGWPTVAACVYLALSLALAWQYLRWSPHLVAWVNYLKTGVSVAICWCCIVLVLLEFKPGVKAADKDKFADLMTILMLAGLAPAFGVGMLMSRWMIRQMTQTALKALANPKALPIREVFNSLDEPRDIEIAARCCRSTTEPYTPDPDAIDKAHRLIKAGLELFPGSAYMLILHANFMIDVLGVSQSGGRRMEEARKLNPSLMCRFIMFIRQQQATQSAAGNVNSSSSMDLLGYVEYQRKQRMVVRLHREALQAMCNFWKELDSHRVSFTHLSKALMKIESSVSQAQTAYRVVLERYGTNPKLVRLYGRFLQTIKNDPWRAAEYTAEAERLEALQDGQAGGPQMPDGTPLSRMDDIDSAVLLINAIGTVQMANRYTHALFGYKRGALEGKHLCTLLAPHFSRWLAGKLASMVALSRGQDARSGSGISGRTSESSVEDAAAAGNTLGQDDVVVGLHSERLAFPVKISLSRASGVGEDSTVIVVIEPMPLVKGEASLWVASNGIVTACDPRFISTFGWKAAEVNGASITTLLSLGRNAAYSSSGVEAGIAGMRPGEGPSDTIKRLVAASKSARDYDDSARLSGQACLVQHKYSRSPLPCDVSVVERDTTAADVAVHHLVVRLTGKPLQLLVVNRKGHVLHSSSGVSSWLKDGAAAAGRGHMPHPGVQQHGHGGLVGLGVQAAGRGALPLPADVSTGAPGEAGATASSSVEALAGYTLFDFLPPPWKDMHVKLLKDITPVSPPAISQWSCRKPIGGEAAGPTLALRSTSGKEVLARLVVETAELGSEVVHIVRMEKSSLQDGLAERRVRLRVSPEGRIQEVVAGRMKQLFGLDPSQVVGHGLWEIVEETPAAAAQRGLMRQGSGLAADLADRALSHPGYSWRVHLVQPVRKNAAEPPAIVSPLQRTSSALFSRSVLTATSAVMQVQLDSPQDQDEADEGDGPKEAAPTLLVDLWPLTSVTGVLQLDSRGRITGILEEQLRPVGLLFGVPSRSLVGSQLAELVAMPPGWSKPVDLLSSGAKKSSLKPNNKDTTAKMGPVHRLEALHADNLTATLEVQVLGRPPPEESYIAMLRFYTAPMVPTAAGGPPGALSPKPSMGLRQSSVRMSPSPGVVLKISSSAAIPGTAAASLMEARSVPNMPAFARASSPATVGRATNSVAVLSPVVGAVKAGSPITPSTPPEAPAGAPAPNVRLNSCLIPDEALEALLQEAEGKEQTAATADAAAAAELPLAAVAPALPAAAALPADGLPQPSVVNGASKSAAELAGRSKLAGLVKSMGAERGSGSLRASDGDRPMGLGKPSGRLGARSSAGRPPPSAAPSLPGSVEAHVWKAGEGRKQSALSRADVTAPPSVIMDTDEAASSSRGDGSEKGQDLKAKPAVSGADRVRDWVASKGAFYQNSVPDNVFSKGPGDLGDADADGDQSSDVDVVPFGGRTPRRSILRADDAGGGSAKPGGAPEGAALGRRGSTNQMYPGAEGLASAPPMDDDAGSDGGQSAVSAAQSASSGTEYTRGKRYKKLIKLMDSAQAQQAQRRLKVQSLIVLGVMAAVHVVCFVLTVTFIQTQRDSMLSLGRSGEALIDMNRIMTDVRCLDIISANKTLPNLFNVSDADTFIARISKSADELKVRFNEILNVNAKKSTAEKVIDVLYNTHREVWDENDPNGSDKYTTLTVWDFATRFYTMAKNIQQYHDDYLAANERIQDTPPGQFLLKSGPDLWIDMRKILDTLLFSAVQNAETIDQLQIAFLVVEGAGVSFIAACYLAYLLGAVATQRYKLYSAFLVVPLGLTRALASQNTNILVDDDDEEDDDDEDERAAMVADPDEDAQPAKLKRRATLRVASDAPVAASAAGGAGDMSFKERRSSTLVIGGNINASMTSVNGGPGSFIMRGGLDKQRTLTADTVAGEEGNRSMLSWEFWKRKAQQARLRRRSTGAVFPMSAPSPMPGGAQANTGAAAAAAAGKKRALKRDNKETVIMLMPFVIWSILVISFYATAVVKMNGVVEVVAVHSVVNLMTGRTYRTVFYGQELANTDNSSLLLDRRKVLYDALKYTRDAWYTLQLGNEAYKAAGTDAEVFPLVTRGVAHSSPEMETLFYSSGSCHRLGDNLPCPGPGYRFYEISNTGVDSIMQQFMISINAMSTNTSLVPEGLEDEHWDFVHNVGAKDLLDGIITIAQVHYDTITRMFEGILILHIILFLLFWVLFIGFIAFLLNPLLKRVTQERRRIAELMSQLPLELDVEKLVGRALGTPPAGAPAPPGAAGAGQPTVNDRGFSVDETAMNNAYGGGYAAGNPEATTKWKAIIKAASSVNGRATNGSITARKSA